ncbi:response regulator [Agarilytica rhodophyticola]|uniref:response regulator n=1 Tax=Agarilytica rhodophyticola TaxID=1737490 RepID=UPI001319FBAC|nr:response regulator [Agarilytica rhodophyticola]
MSFSLAIVIGLFITVPYIEKSILEIQETASQTEKKLTSEYLERFVLDRVSVLQDISRYPIVKNAVMGSGISQADLSDFLDDITILGKHENMTLLNIAAESVYSRTVSMQFEYDMESPWFNRLIEGESPFEVNLVHQENINYFQLAVPVDLRNSVEGILVSEIEIDLLAMISLFFSSGERSLTLSKNGVTLDSASSGAPKQTLTLTHTIPSLSIEMQYKIDTQNMAAQKDAFLWRIMGSIALTMGLTFLVILVSGNITIIAPYKRLQEITEERNQARIAAEESVRVKGEFLASMSHEIRTPLNGVLGMLSLLMRGDLKDQQRHYAKLAKTSAESLLTLINDILDFSKIEAGKLDLEIIDFNLSTHLEEFANAMGYRAQEKKNELLLDSRKITHSMVKGDPGRLRQILTNLVGNAIKFTQKGEIVIRTELILEDNGKAKFICSVKDSGIGIPKNKINKLFKSFSQVDASTTRKYGGTGLGLAIVKQLCELMDGSISVISEEGIGSEFIFNVTLGISEQKVHKIPALNIHDKYILVVDDNTTNREILRAQLEKWGAKVIEAIDAQAALEILEDRVKNNTDEFFSVAILDMQMPGMNGASLGKKIRKNQAFDSMKMIMMTSMGERGDARYFADLGFAAYFPKPSTESELHDALAIIMENGEALSQAMPLLNRHNLKQNTSSDSSIIITPDQSTISTNPHRIRLLLVEDNPINQEVALGILEDLYVHTDIANNGLEALDALEKSNEQTRHKLILMDCQMPEMDGYQTTKQIRKGGNNIPNPTIPIIAMTANAMKGDKEKCLASGMDDYLTKPIDPDELTKKLKKWLNSELITEVKDLGDKKISNVVSLTESIWDKESALKRVRGKEERLNTLVNMFLDNIPDKIDSLKENIAQGSTEEASAIAHSIKGSVSNLGAIKLQEISQEIELAKNDENKMKELLPEFIKQYELLKETLENHSSR